MAVMRQSVIAVIVAIRWAWPLRQASPKICPSSQYGDGRFLTPFGNDCGLYSSMLYVKDRVRDRALNKDVCIFFIVRGRSSAADQRKKLVRIVLNGPRLLFLHCASLWKRAGVNTPCHRRLPMAGLVMEPACVPSPRVC